MRDEVMAATGNVKDYTNCCMSKFHRSYGHADIFLDRYAYTPSII